MPTKSSGNRGLLITIVVLLSIIILGGTFFLGSRIGNFQCARQSFRQLRDVGVPPEMLNRPGLFEPGMGRGMMMRGHGVAGEVLSVDEDTITVLGRDGEERTLVIGSGTRIGTPESPQTIEDIAVGAKVIGFGEPDDNGSVQVHHISVMPE